MPPCHFSCTLQTLHLFSLNHDQLPAMYLAVLSPAFLSHRGTTSRNFHRCNMLPCHSSCMLLALHLFSLNHGQSPAMYPAVLSPAFLSHHGTTSRNFHRCSMPLCHFSCTLQILHSSSLIHVQLQESPLAAQVLLFLLNCGTFFCKFCRHNIFYIHFLCMSGKFHSSLSSYDLKQVFSLPYLLYTRHNHNVSNLHLCMTVQTILFPHYSDANYHLIHKLSHFPCNIYMLLILLRI